MRAFRYILGAVAAWVCASALGALAAWGPARWVRGEWTTGTLLAGVAIAVVLTALVWLVLRVSYRRWVRAVVAVACVPLAVIAALPVGIATWAAYPAHADLAGTTPSGAVDVSIPVAGGDALAAWYLPTHNGAAVVLSHGAGCTRDDVMRHARVLSDAGYGVLMVDARGHGESTGAAMDMGWWGEEDITAAIDVLVHMPDVDPHRIGLVGLSMGGEESIGTAGVDDRVTVVVAEGATGRTAEDKDGWLPWDPAGFVQRGMDAERDLLLAWLTDAPKPRPLREAAATSAADMLLITAGSVPDEARAAAWIAKGNHRVTVWTVPGAVHTGGLDARPDEWTERVVGFLNDALGA